MSLTQVDILGCKLNPLSMEQCLEMIARGIRSGKAMHVITLNAEIAYQARQNQALQNVINQADLVTADGIGVVWGARHLGYSVPERVTGIDLMQRLTPKAAEKGWPIYLLGAKPGVAQKAAQELSRRWPALIIAGFHDGYFTAQEVPGIVEEINSSAAQILFVALGAPKQEFWIREHFKELTVPIRIGVGGSLDVIAGQKKRAPGIFIKLNLEWLYRLITEPSRLRRQLTLPLFVCSILWEGLQRRHR
ncbi:MAG: WecB/TagA/CpsF family glycosyltransferase [Syntrophomonadaceae bacterium]|mgnify:CR=1 FL=1|jgi:N-acetylglucosaminyldiphosphoundecaprenol N-acetyl-beta-D-mannosaminyltransferase|nr:WecB/TagA/CpsF family glycosyltransferase [Syntrophomonadaceae bacterium]